MDLESAVALIRARRQQARRARWIVWPVTVPLVVFSAAHEADVLSFASLVAAIAVLGYFQFRAVWYNCPRCQRPLEVWHWWGRSYPPDCPHCGLHIGPA